MPKRQTYARGKTALVLAGGGVTGAVYEIGALRAIDDLLVDRTVNDFDIYVGTSAGSLVNTMLANGVSPEAMLQVFRGASPDIRRIENRDILDINRRTLLDWGIGVPRGIVGIVQSYLQSPEDLNFFELLWSLSELLPAGLYDSGVLERYVREVLSGAGRTNRFGELKRELYLVATDLNTGERMVFSNTTEGVAISQAVAASTALPPVYRPVHIGNKVYVDGGLRGTASLDLAIENGATLIVCINPLVPYDNSSWGTGPFFHLEPAATWIRRACRPWLRRCPASARTPVCTTTSRCCAGSNPGWTSSSSGRGPTTARCSTKPMRSPCRRIWPGTGTNR